MKLLCLGDLHITDKTPVSRIDEYWNTMIHKLSYAFHIAQQMNCSAILQPGDFFDSDQASDFLKQYMISFLKMYDIPVFCVYGQHDLRYHGRDVSNTPLRVLEAAGVVDVVPPQGFFFCRDGEEIHIHGLSWNQKPYPTDSEFTRILLVHTMLIPDKKIWWNQTQFAWGHDYLDRNSFDLIVSGDNHEAFLVQKDNKILVNPGSIMRSRSNQFAHAPMFFVYDTLTKKIVKIPFPIKPFSEVTDVEKDIQASKKNQELETLVQELRKEDLSKNSDFGKTLDGIVEKQGARVQKMYQLVKKEMP